MRRVLTAAAVVVVMAGCSDSGYINDDGPADVVLTHVTGDNVTIHCDGTVWLDGGILRCITFGPDGNTETDYPRDWIVEVRHT